MSQNKTFLYINSKDRNGTPLTSTKSFNYNLNIGVRENTYYFFKSATIPLSAYQTVYATPDGTNESYISFNDTSGVANVSIPSGNYSGAQLASILQTNLNANGALNHSYTVTFSTITGKFTISNSAGNFIIAWSSNNNNLNGQALGYIFGYTGLNGTGGNSTGANSYTSINVANLSGPLNYYLKSNSFITADCNGFFQTVPDIVMSRIPINGGAFSVIYFENPVDDYVPMRLTNAQALNFQLVDSWNNPVNLNGQDYEFCIVLANRMNI